MAGGEPHLEAMRERMSDAERRLDSVEGDMEKLDGRLRDVEQVMAGLKAVPQQLQAISTAVQDVRAGRPTWGVATLFGMMLAAISALTALLMSAWGHNA